LSSTKKENINASDRAAFSERPRPDPPRAEVLPPCKRALALAQPESYVRIFVDKGEPIRLLMVGFQVWIEKQAHGQSPALTGYVDRLLAAFVPPVASPSCAIRHPQSASVEPLSERELEILRLFGPGLPNRASTQRLLPVKQYSSIIL
jgi:LuxR family transcriptional regulator, maltose regulon positive regulatory protein